ncbi:hypothetical protein PENSUB_11802 [Penicillium subrubescens]|uniref:Uncharacterized protein n=1 Tax=Penicillium subrubescens TaxID=1316194 RepID=A0A1Q5T323_9EURO|nr:hypothetical protein PENSUB_11802 [Penicillium subrubescens]
MPTLEYASSFANLPAVSEDYSAPQEYQLKAVDPLEEFDDFDTWLEDVIQTLRPQNLHRLIDAYVKRPPKTSPEVSRWVKTSRDIRYWMYQSVCKDINKLVLARRFRCEFADEYFELLKQVTG